MMQAMNRFSSSRLQETDAQGTDDMIAQRTSSPFLIACGLALGPTVALGFARFAYALLLPVMRQDLQWSYSLAGGMNTANALGYLIGALAAGPLMRIVGARVAFIGALVLTALALLASGSSDVYAWLLVARTIAGIGGAIIFVTGGALTAHVASSVPKQSGLLLTTYYAGAGFGILLSGISLPFAIQAGSDWRFLWVALGLVALVIGFISSLTAWRLPDQRTQTASASSVSPWILAWSFAAYFCFALGYIAYMTFSVAFIRANGAGPLEVAIFWAVLGIAAMLAPTVWSAPITRWPAAQGLSAALLAVALGAALPLVSSALPVMLVSAVCFGGSFLSVVAATTALARRYLPSSAWSAGIALFTVIFAAGQSLGPLVSGILSDGAGGLRAGLGWSAAVLALGAVIALVQAPPKPQA
jgi:predicted MFS family arabinose efflux permease